MKRELIDKMIAESGATTEQREAHLAEFLEGIDDGHLIVADIINNRDPNNPDKSLFREVSKLMLRYQKTTTPAEKIHLSGAVQGLCWVVFDSPDGPTEALRVQAERRVGGPAKLEVT